MTAQLSRRSVLLGAAASALLTGCSAKSQTAATRVSFLNWQDYVDPSLLADFTTRSGLAVGYETYDSNDALYKRLVAADVTRKGGRKTTSFDLIVPSNNLFRRLRADGALQPLDTSIVTEALLNNLNPALRSMATDPGNRYSVPWATGTTGIGYDTTVFPTPPTWEIFADRTHTGRMTLLNEAREAFAVALFLLGKDPNSSAAADVAAATTTLAEILKASTLDSATYLNRLANGELVAAHGYSTDVLQARKRNPKLAFTIPPQGGTRWVDLLCVPVNAPNPAGANQLIAFYLDPKISATNAVYNLVATGNLAARAFVPKTVLDDPSVYPPDAVADKLVFLNDLGEQDVLYENAWQELQKAQR